MASEDAGAEPARMARQATARGSVARRRRAIRRLARPRGRRSHRRPTTPQLKNRKAEKRNASDREKKGGGSVE